MAEEEKTELPEITEEKIEKAALPENKRVDEEISEEATFVELDEADVKELGPVTERKLRKTLNRMKWWRNGSRIRAKWRNVRR